MMTWEMIMHAWDDLLSNWYVEINWEIVSEVFLTWLLCWFTFTLIAVWCAYFFGKEESKETLHKYMLYSITGSSIFFIILYLLSITFDSRISWEAITRTLVYYALIWVAATTFTGTGFYYIANTNWDKNPGKTAFKKCRPYWFIILWAILMLDIIISILIK